MKTDRAELDRISPALMPDQFDDPVLLIHGTDDGIVQVSHSGDMYKALKSAGKDVSFLEIEEGHYHNLWSIESSTTYFERIEAFLTEVFPHKNGAQAQDSLP
jgi:dipeptidyl aminopeptidase/acylaminoacyl peptidase